MVDTKATTRPRSNHRSEVKLALSLKEKQHA
jgi:hypothetical protein